MYYVTYNKQTHYTCAAESLADAILWVLVNCPNVPHVRGTLGQLQGTFGTHA